MSLSFGEFLKDKRLDKNLTQKQLASLLFVSESAVSKWEKGVSHPDITMLPKLCEILGVSEHELITASVDNQARKEKREAKKWRALVTTWELFFYISYGVAILTCFICNLAVNHTLSWFFIVLASLLCAYTFIPTVTSFFKTKKLLVFSVTTYLSLCLLLFTCAVYTNDLSWFLTSCIGVLIGYELLFVPILL